MKWGVDDCYCFLKKGCELCLLQPCQQLIKNIDAIKNSVSREVTFGAWFLRTIAFVFSWILRVPWDFECPRVFTTKILATSKYQFQQLVVTFELHLAPATKKVTFVTSWGCIKNIDNARGRSVIFYNWL